MVGQNAAVEGDDADTHLGPMSAAARQPVLLGHSYYLRYDEKQVRKMKPYPPLSTLTAASVVRARGFKIRFFDAMLASGVEAFYAALEDTRPSIVGILEDNFNFLTKMCTVRMREACFDMIRAAKAQGCRVAVNGSDATDQPARYLRAGADAVIAGEPDFTFAELVERWSAHRDPSLLDIPGLVLPNENGPSTGDGAGQVRYTPTRPFIDNLDALPLPAWDLVDVERYRDAWTRAHGLFSWSVVTSRGCPYHCNWCAKPVFGTRYTQRGPADVAEELLRLRDEVSPDRIWVADDIFGLTARWIEEFSKGVVARDAMTPFVMQSRVNLMTPRVCAALAAAGAAEVWLGVESGSQRILDAMDKGTKIEQVRTATRNLRAHGIRSCWFIQLGYRGEGWDDILSTRDLIRRERPDDIGVSVSYPLPGTKFYDTVKEGLGGKTHWYDSDDLAMMFQGQYETSFYKMIRDVLHDEVCFVSAPNLSERWAELERREPEFRRQASYQYAGAHDGRS